MTESMEDVIETMKDLGALTRPEIVVNSGRSAATVDRALAALLAEGVVISSTVPRKGRAGRPSKLWRLAPGAAARRWPLSVLRQARERQNAGERTADIAAELGCTPRALQRAMDNNLPGEGPKISRAPHTPRSPENRAYYLQAWAVRQDGATWREVARRMGWTGHPDALATSARRHARALPR